MKSTRQISQRFFAMLCIIFLLIYISAAFFPHSHPHRDADCALCVVLQSSRKILCALTLFAFLALTVYKPSLVYAYTHLLPIRDATPVSLKVKLSD